MVDVDRRAVFGVAGLAVAGLGLDVVGSTPAVAGVDRQFGIDPRSPLPPSPAFAPRRICVVMIGIGAKMAHSLAHYEFPAAISASAGEAAAGEVIRYHLAVGSFPKKAASGKMVGVSSDFNDFRCSGQARMYFYLTGSNIEFGSTNNNAIRFTTLNYAEQAMAANNSFYEAKLISLAGVPKLVQSMSNLSIGANGQILLPQTTGQTYSVNIVGLMQASSGRPIPIIIDPEIKNDGPPK